MGNQMGPRQFELPRRARVVAHRHLRAGDLHGHPVAWAADRAHPMCPEELTLIEHSPQHRLQSRRRQRDSVVVIVPPARADTSESARSGRRRCSQRSRPTKSGNSSKPRSGRSRSRSGGAPPGTGCAPAGNCPRDRPRCRSRSRPPRPRATRRRCRRSPSPRRWRRILQKVDASPSKDLSVRESSSAIRNIARQKKAIQLVASDCSSRHPLGTSRERSKERDVVHPEEATLEEVRPVTVLAV